MVRQICITALGAFFLISLAGCHISTKTSEINDSSCTVKIKDRNLFVGTIPCLDKLKKTMIDGYWVVDHEYSVMYDNIPQNTPAYDENATWLELRPEASLFYRSHVKSPGRKIFKIRFFGTRSSNPGIYGPGEFKTGALVHHFVVLQKIS